MASPASRAFITGCGTISPLGCSVDAFWHGLVAGRSALAPIRGFDTAGLNNTLAGEVPDFVAAQHLSAGEAERLDRIGQYALAAARQAVRDAGLELARIDPQRAGVIAATTLGGMQLGEAYLRARRERTPFDARRLLHMPYADTAARLARQLACAARW
jgi:3-oxoacyl-[acyl-carrier-protein] synthase II